MVPVWHSGALVAAPTTTMQTTARPEIQARPRRKPLDEDDQPRAPWERAVGWGIVAVATWLVFSILDSNHNWTIHLGAWRWGDLFLNTTPTAATWARTSGGRNSSSSTGSRGTRSRCGSRA